LKKTIVVCGIKREREKHEKRKKLTKQNQLIKQLRKVYLKEVVVFSLIK